MFYLRGGEANIMTQVAGNEFPMLHNPGIL